jgi:hypothetical protein
VRTVLERVKKVRRAGDGWVACCPAHEDAAPSLSIAEGRDSRALLRCHAGCSLPEILTAIGLSTADLFADDVNRPVRSPPARSTPVANRANTQPPQQAPEASAPTPWPVVATYDYVDQDGQLVYQVRRKEPATQSASGKREKTFDQRRPGPDGWIASIRDIPERPLFRLPELVEDLAHERTIFLVEGEKDCITLREWGYAATTHSGGAKAWRPEYARQLSGASVVIIPDNDDPGRAWAATAGEALVDAGAAVRMLVLPVTAVGADVSDWVAAGGTRPQLDALIGKAIPWKPGDEVGHPAQPPKFKLLSVADLEELPAMDWLIGEEMAGIFPAQSLIGFFGAPGSGKSFIAADLACTVARRGAPPGLVWFGNAILYGPVLYVAAEGGRGFRHRVIAWRGHHRVSRDGLALSFVLEPVNLFGPDDISHILRVADLLPEPPRLIVFDTVARSMVGGDENSAQDMGLVIDRADRVKRETGSTVLLVHHSRKDGDVERGSGALRAGVDTLCLVKEDEETGGRVLACEKQKDAEPFSPITFYLAPAGDSCVVSTHAPSGRKTLTRNQRDALRTLADCFPIHGATSSEWQKASSVAERSFYRIRPWLLRQQYVKEEPRGNSVRYYLEPRGKIALNESIL